MNTGPINVGCSTIAAPQHFWSRICDCPYPYIKPKFASVVVSQAKVCQHQGMLMDENIARFDVSVDYPCTLHKDFCGILYILNKLEKLRVKAAEMPLLEGSCR